MTTTTLTRETKIAEAREISRTVVQFDFTRYTWLYEARRTSRSRPFYLIRFTNKVETGVDTMILTPVACFLDGEMVS